MVESEVWHKEKDKVIWYLIRPNLGNESMNASGWEYCRSSGIVCNMVTVKVMNSIKKFLKQVTEYLAILHPKYFCAMWSLKLRFFFFNTSVIPGV